jgi:hypothetical protein
VRKAIFLTSQFPPIVTSGSSRAWKFASNLTAIGWEPIVVAPQSVKGMDAARTSGLNPVAELLRTGPDIDASILEPADMNALLHGQPVKFHQPLRKRLTRLFRNDQVIVPWEKNAPTLVERLLVEHPDIDLLYAQGPPIEPLLLALETAKKHTLTVVLDITAPLDPAMPPPGASGSSSEAEIEARVLLSGVPMITPTRILKEYFLKKYSGRLDHGAMTIVPHAFDSSHPAFRQKGPKTPERVMRIALLVDELPKSDLKAFFQGLETWVRLDGISPGDVELSIFGEGAPEVGQRAARSPIRQMLAVDAAGSLDDQLAHCRQADLFCTVLGRSAINTCIVPDRLVDALGMGLPLCGILPEGAASRLVAEAGGMTATPDDAAGIAELFRAMVSAWRSRSLRGAPEELLQRHAVGTVIHELTGAIATQHVS